MGKTVESKPQFRTEIFLALIITGLACSAGFSNLLLASNQLYPAATDFMGHMCKVRFLAECLSKGEFPTWFPYWYNGTAVAQYYSPLSYWIMTPIYLFAQNVMVTFKIYNFAVLFIGGMGTWLFCRRKIAKWCGLFAAAVFCLQPYILLTIFREGQIAQEPIIALVPWYLLVLTSLSQNPTKKKYVICTVISVAMILSHASSAFMTCTCVAGSLLVFTLLRKINIRTLCLVISTIVFGGALTAFWSLVGVTGLENPGTPEVLIDRAKFASATIDWFLNTNPNSFFVFAIPASVGFAAAALLFFYFRSKKQLGENENFYVPFLIIFTIVTVLFSFGSNLWLFNLIPMAKTLFAGRILSATAASTAILCGYLLSGLWRLTAEKGKRIKAVACIVCIIIIGATLYGMNPYKFTYLIYGDSDFSKMMSSIDIGGTNFEKGRYDYQFYSGYNSSEDYYTIRDDFNATQGVNIEGTQHNNTLWNQNLALSVGDSEYVEKNQAFWNVRYLLLRNDFQKDFEQMLKRESFVKKADREGNTFYASKEPSSYFMTDPRNALLLGSGAPAIALEFPYLVYEQRTELSDYTLAELEKYKLIYLSEPAVDTIQQKESIEKKVTALAERGTTVVIEPVTTKGFPLFGVSTSEVMTEVSPVIVKQPTSGIDSDVNNIQINDGLIYSKVLFGLDRPYYKLLQNDGRLQNDVIGVKYVGKGKVVFLGMHLSQYLKAVYATIWGLQDEDRYPSCMGQVKSLFEDMFKTYGVNTDFWPKSFPVEHAVWKEKGVDFSYSSRNARNITVSVTYTPRWHATIDGKPLAVGQKENLITLDLPAGEHKVSLVYGVTKYGIAGYIISALGLIVFLLFIGFYDIITRLAKRIFEKVGKYLQII